MTDYVPIACAEHDRIEAAATLRQPVHVEWEGADGIEIREGLIEDIRVRGGAEYLLLAGEEIRLDRIQRLETIRS